MSLESLLSLISEEGMMAAMEPPAVTLQAPPTTAPAFTSAEILPGRGMMTLQVRARLPKLGEVDLIASPPLAEARSRFERSAGQPFPGNGSYLFGGAVLPEARGRGAYRALVHARWQDAVARGTPLAVTDAGSQSREAKRNT